ncbi:peptidylprolyl isomerase [Flavobacterium sp. AG291]|uniref:peptidylprolyl isomerase n=1 Tax=Flavobacterium sp. AG291 TaxID=2184000 RepID=UPI000E0B801C|nr:peptidylprolyl isomerase [Flavobacterium sp. AG291]RDI08010.1 parvulin-like peptidyl-prolyl cis-trans isomerase protein [Flavobacterium sp. AG291]
MKTIALLLVPVFWLTAKAQEIPTPTQAKDYIESHINPTIDISELDKKFDLLKNHKPGDVVVDGKNIYKFIETTSATAYNAGYIYLDGKKLAQEEISRLTNEIFAEYNSGTSFADLIKKYSMDKNPNAAEMKFTDGQMVGTFEKAVKEHTAGEVFTVITAEKGWYHIVKKNAENQTIKAIRVEYAAYKSS